MKQYLESLGISGAENLAARLIFAIWSALDWHSPLWKSAGADVFNRFESRVRTAARARTLADFVSALGRRCHVAVPRLEEVDRADMAGEAAADVLCLCRENSGLTVATMRLWLDLRKEMRKPVDPNLSLFGGAN